uniref:Uncharacterized protein n=1 Tax=Sphaerodactylus townsendi TaxID=933632 RepID=A0ACB8FRY6_9SAUR
MVLRCRLGLCTSVLDNWWACFPNTYGKRDVNSDRNHSAFEVTSRSVLGAWGSSGACIGTDWTWISLCF